MVMTLTLDDRETEIFEKKFLVTLTDTAENVQKWTRVFSTRRWVILVARTRRKKEENTRVHFWPNSPVDKFRVLACIG